MAEKKKSPDEDSGFKVTDKRHFTSDGDTVPDAPEETAAEAKSAPPAEEPSPPPPPEESAPPPGGGPEEQVDFTHLVMSLASSAFISLGVPDPVTKQKGEVNLKAASQMIDLLAVIEEKTKGNLTPQEEQILKGIMTDLRRLFVQSSGFGK